MNVDYSKCKQEISRDFVKISQASKLSGIGLQTLRKMADNKSVTSFTTPSGQRLYCKKSLQKMCSSGLSIENKEKITKLNFLYTRVSTRKQLDDLQRQSEYVKRPEYADYTLIQDVGSGINFQRKGLQKILDACLQGSIGEVVVSHKDRLSRFGFDLLNILITKAGGKITLLDNDENKSSEQELADDLLSIVHIFSCRQMGKRSYRNRNKKTDEIQITSCSNLSDS